MCGPRSCLKCCGKHACYMRVIECRRIVMDVSGKRFDAQVLISRFRRTCTALAANKRNISNVFGCVSFWRRCDNSISATASRMRNVHTLHVYTSLQSTVFKQVRRVHRARRHNNEGFIFINGLLFVKSGCVLSCLRQLRCVCVISLNIHSCIVSICLFYIQNPFSCDIDIFLVGLHFILIDATEFFIELH